MLKRNNVEFKEVIRMEEALPQLDILYMTRVQKERFFNEEDYVRMKDFYILDKKKMQLPEPIRTFGVTEVAIKLHPKVVGKFNVHVVEE